MQCHSSSTSLVRESDGKWKLYSSSSGTVLSVAANSSSSSSGSRGGNCSSNTEFHKLLEKHLKRIIRFSKNTASTRRALKKHSLTIKAEQRKLQQNALVLQTYKEKFAPRMSKEPSTPSSPFVPAVPHVVDAMSSRRKTRKVSIIKPSVPNPGQHPDNTSCTFSSSSMSLPRKVSFAVQAHNSKLYKTEDPIAALIPNDYFTGSSRGSSICSTIEVTLDQDVLIDNEFIISEDDSILDDDEDMDPSMVLRKGNSPHVEMFQSQFFPLDF